MADSSRGPSSRLGRPARTLYGHSRRSTRHRRGFTRSRSRGRVGHPIARHSRPAKDLAHSAAAKMLPEAAARLQGTDPAHPSDVVAPTGEPELHLPIPLQKTLREVLPQVGEHNPDLRSLAHEAQKEMAEMRKDPHDRHIVQRLINSVARGGWSLVTLTFGAGLAAVKAFLSLFSTQGTGLMGLVLLIVGFALGTAGAAVASIAYSYSTLASVLVGLVVKLAWDFTGLRNYAVKNKWRYKVHARDPDSFISRLGLDAKRVLFPFYSRFYHYVDWDLFRKQHTNLGLFSKEELWDLFQLYKKHPERYDLEIKRVLQARLANLSPGAPHDNHQRLAFLLTQARAEAIRTAPRDTTAPPAAAARGAARGGRSSSHVRHGRVTPHPDADTLLALVTGTPFRLQGA